MTAKVTRIELQECMDRLIDKIDKGFGDVQKSMD
jgi:hypothetical protein